MKNKNYMLAMYLRLSRDDEDIDGNTKSESNSISSQRELIRAFIREHDDMELYDIYIDDGFTGSNFERPEFKRMIEDVEVGKVNCVIVKDLSRFGRDYIEAGRFIQKTFPALGVRFIAITDNYDSLTADSSESAIVLPVKNFINDSYCRDISVKVKSHQQMKRKNGEFIGASAVYGYLKNPENKNKLIVDDYAAENVRKIFMWKIEGNSAISIAKKLNELGVQSPMDYKKSLGIKFNTGFSSGKKSAWSAVAVKRILTNETYIGHLVQGKSEKINYKVKKTIQKPQLDWVRVENTHEAIVCRDDFNIVQNLLRVDGRKSNRVDSTNIFSQVLFCGDCREQMVRRINRYKGDEKVFYICSTKNRGEGCTRHSIEEKKLQTIVHTTVRKYAHTFIKQSELLEEAKKKEINFAVVSMYDKEMQRLKKEQEKYYKLCSGLYEDLKNDIISKPEFDKLQRTYTQNSKDLELSVKKQKELIETMFLNGVAAGSRLQNFRNSIDLFEIDRHTLVSLVHRIYIYEDNHIEIELNFKNEFEAMVGINQSIDTKSQDRGTKYA